MLEMIARRPGLFVSVVLPLAVLIAGLLETPH